MSVPSRIGSLLQRAARHLAAGLTLALLTSGIAHAVTSTTSLALSNSTRTVGQSVTLTATITGATTITGTVTFKAGTTTLGTATVASKKATFTTSFATVGSRSITAAYGGDANNTASTSSAKTLTVNKATPTNTLSATPNPATVGQSVTLTATLAGGVNPTGTVTFKNGTTTLGTASVSNNVATFTTNFASTGTRSLTAAYAGDANHNSRTSSTVSLPVNAALTATTTSLSAAPNPATVGQSVTLTATVTGGSPTGTVTFRDGSTTLGTGTLSGNTATFSTSSLAQGSHSLNATYGGNSTHATSTSSAVSLNVNPAIVSTTTSLTASPSPASVGQSLTLTASVTGGSPTGTVTFKEGTQVIGSASLSNGVASFGARFINAGSYTLSAEYPGNAGHQASSGTASLTVNPAAASPSAQSILEYDPMGQLTRATNPLGVASEQSWDSLGRLAQTRQPNPTAPGTQGTIGYVYDGRGQLKRLTDPRNLNTDYTTDGLGNTTALVSPDTGSTTYQYDEAGNLKQKTDARNIVTSYQYDALNRPTQAVWSQGGTATETILFGYDQGNGVGMLTSLSDNSGQTTWSYDTEGRLASRTQQTDTRTLTSSYGYDSAGRLATHTYPSGRQVSYSYDEGGKITEIRLNGQILLTQIRHSPFGAVEGWIWGNAKVHDRTFDANGRLTRHSLADNTRHLGWDAASRLTAVHEQQNSANTAGLVTEAGYDRLDRLTSQNTASTNYGYGYDLSGNRSTQTAGASTTTYNTATTSNRLNTTTGGQARSYSYDAAGNPNSDGIQSYTWTGSGKLQSLTRGTTTTTYAYNGFAQRVKKSNGTETRYYAYDEAGHLIGEYDGSGNPVQEHLWLGDTPVVMVQGTSGTTYYVQADHLDTPRALTDSAGQIVWRWEGEAFGLSPANEDPDGNSQTIAYNLRFPGQYYDKESNLYYNHHRYYDPTTGRYISSDPIGLEGGINTFLYAEANPLSWTDPLGLKTMQCTKPLNALGPKWGPVGYQYGPLLYHQYSCVVGKDGKVTCGGQDRGENGEGKPSNDVLDPPGGQCKETQPDNNCFEQCLITEWAKPRPKYGIPFGTDCQEYDDEVNARCRKQCNIKK